MKTYTIKEASQILNDIVTEWNLEKTRYAPVEKNLVIITKSLNSIIVKNNNLFEFLFDQINKKPNLLRWQLEQCLLNHTDLPYKGDLIRFLLYVIDTYNEGLKKYEVPQHFRGELLKYGLKL